MNGRLPRDLPDRLRSWGLTVVEEPGWLARGAPTLDPVIVLRHHTATRNPNNLDFPSRRVLIEGRAGLPGPLSQIGLARSGIVHLIASGKANHAGRGEWAGCTGNREAIGVEAENDGVQGWPQPQLDAWDLLDACLLVTIGQPASHLCAHREFALPKGRKVDPHDMPMDAVRDRVVRLLHHSPITEVRHMENDVTAISCPTGGVWVLQRDGGIRNYLGAPFLGSYPGLPPADRQGQRTFVNMEATAKGYRLLAVNADGSAAAYDFHRPG